MKRNGVFAMAVSLEDICKLVALELGIKKVNKHDHLRRDLGAESLDIQAMVTAVEDKYSISVNDEDLAQIHTVTDFYQLVKDRL